MTFSSDLRDELARVKSPRICCAKAELAGMVNTCATLHLVGGEGLKIGFSTDSGPVARKLFIMLKMHAGEKPAIQAVRQNRLGGGNMYQLLNSTQSTKRLLEVLHIPQGPQTTLPHALLKKDCCKRAYLRGLFLGSGSLSNPNKGYHMEFVLEREEIARSVCKLLLHFQISAKIISRKSTFVVYLKDSEHISTLLGLMSASRALFALENIRLLKGMRNGVNRAVNCETANVEKTVAAAVRQTQSIRHLQEHIGLDALPPPLREVAYARLENPEATLQELGELLSVPLGKSGINHRLRKLQQLARSIT